jgi:cyclase
MNKFLFEPVADGVWAALSQDPIYAMSNAAIIDLGDKTLIFDSSMSAIAALELRQFAEEVTQKPVSYLVNSHHHLDHCLGNQVFADCLIIASHTTRDFMQARFARLIAESNHLTEALQTMQTQVARTPWEKNLLALELAELEMFQNLMPNFKATLPSLTFSQSLEITGSQRTVQLQTFGAGHTILDTVLITDDLLITGDLVLNKNIGFMGYEDPTEWLKRLNDLEGLDGIRHVIPGHGAVGHFSLIADMRQQLLEMIALGQSIEDVSTAQPPEPWLEYGLPASYRANLSLLQSKNEV